MIARLKLWLFAAGAAVVAVLSAFAMGRREGRQKAVTDALKGRVEANEQAREARDEVNDMGADDRRDQLADWLRDGRD